MAEEAIITLGVCEKGRLVGKLISWHNHARDFVAFSDEGVKNLSLTSLSFHLTMGFVPSIGLPSRTSTSSSRSVQDSSRAVIRGP